MVFIVLVRPSIELTMLPPICFSTTDEKLPVCCGVSLSEMLHIARRVDMCGLR